MTQEEFYNEIFSLSTSCPDRELETYLLALLKLVEEQRNESFSSHLLLKLLKEAFTAEPATFDPEWLKIENAPDENIMSKKFTNPDFSKSIDKGVVSKKEGIDYTIAVLHFQIAELHKMKGDQLEDPMKSLGIDSTTGNRWYNFDPFTNLECGTRGLLDNSDEDDDQPFHSEWQTLGELLEMGRIYE